MNVCAAEGGNWLWVSPHAKPDLAGPREERGEGEEKRDGDWGRDREERKRKRDGTVALIGSTRGR